MAGQANFTPSEADYETAMRAGWIAQVRSRDYWRRLAILSGGTGAVLGVAVAFLSHDPLQGAVSAVVGIIGGIGGLLLFLALCFALLPRRSRRLFAQQRSLHHEQALIWNDAGAAWRSPVASMDMAWMDYHSWHDSKRTFLLYLNEQMPHFLPKRALSEAQAADLRATLVEHGPPRR